MCEIQGEIKMKDLRLKKILRVCWTMTLMSTLVLSLIIFQGCAGKSELDSSGANRRVARRTARRTAQRVERRTDRRDNRPSQPGDNYFDFGKLKPKGSANQPLKPRQTLAEARRPGCPTCSREQRNSI